MTVKGSPLNSVMVGLQPAVPAGEHAEKDPGGRVEFHPEKRALMVKFTGSWVARTPAGPTGANAVPRDSNNKNSTFDNGSSFYPLPQTNMLCHRQTKSHPDTEQETAQNSHRTPKKTRENRNLPREGHKPRVGVHAPREISKYESMR